MLRLGNKWFTPENIVGQIKWALQFTRKYVVVYVADSIHAINLEIRNDISYERALRLATAKGDKILEEVEKSVRGSFNEDDVQRVLFAKWKDLVDEKYLKKTEFLYSLYDHDDAFRSSIHNLVRNYIKEEKKTFSKEEIDRLGMYILEELPEVVGRIRYGEAWQTAKCFTNVGTLDVNFYHASTHFQFFQASTTVGTVNMGNTTDTSGDKVYVDIGTPATAPTSISCTVNDII